MSAHARWLFAAMLASGACSQSPPAARRDSTVVPADAGVTRDQAVRTARQFIAKDSSVAAAIHLDSVDVADGGAVWHVMFRRRAMVVPNVVTVDVDRRTGSMRYPGDE
jgi:hypothetical protein